MKKHLFARIATAALSVILMLVLMCSCVPATDTASGTESKSENNSSVPEPSAPSESSTEVSAEISGEESVNEPSEESSEASSEEPSEESVPDETSGGKEDETVKYYVFGDSIAYGYGLSDPATMCYGALFAANFEEIDMTNYAVSGDKTSDMLEVLNGVNISDADLVSVSIGANNLLGPAIGALSGALSSYGTDIITEYLKVLQGAGDTAKVEAFIKALDEAFRNQSFTAQAEAGLASLKTDLRAIFDSITAQSPDAVILMQTIYNPYIGIKLAAGSTSFDLGARGDELIKPFNDAIVAIANDYPNVVILDIHTFFETLYNDEDARLINAGFITQPVLYFNYDPHPNAMGHEVIANILTEIYSRLKRAG